MSSTKRNEYRAEHDYYATPLWMPREFMGAMLEFEPRFLHCNGALDVPAYVLDPCAGGDAHAEMPYPLVLQEFGVPAANITTVDVRQDSRAQYKMDYLTEFEANRFPYDVIITNPPFAIAQAIIEKALAEVNYGGWVIMLQRLNFLGTKARLPFWKANRAKYVFVHSSRPSFVGHIPQSERKGKNTTDSIEYAHFVWQRGWHERGTYTHLEVI